MRQEQHSFPTRRSSDLTEAIYAGATRNKWVRPRIKAGRAKKRAGECTRDFHAYRDGVCWHQNDEWDPQKARENRNKHGVSFDQAATVLQDARATSIFDD